MATAEDIKSGWVQVNNTVVPFVERDVSGCSTRSKLVPLPVLIYGANLQLDPTLLKIPATPQDYGVLQDCCVSAGIDFEFPKDLDLVMLDLLHESTNSQIVIRELSNQDPFVKAIFNSELETEPINLTCNNQSISQNGTDEWSSECFMGEDMHLPLDLSRTMTEIHKELAVNQNDCTTQTGCASGRNMVSKDPVVTTESAQFPSTTTTLKYNAVQRHRMKTRSDGFVSVFGRRLPYISACGSKYIKLELLHRVFFYRWSLREFLAAVASIMQSPVQTFEEINYLTSGIHKQLRCSKAMLLQDIITALPKVKNLLLKPHITYRQTKRGQVHDSSESTLKYDDVKPNLNTLPNNVYTSKEFVKSHTSTSSDACDMEGDRQNVDVPISLCQDNASSSVCDTVDEFEVDLIKSVCSKQSKSHKQDGNKILSVVNKLHRRIQQHD